MTKAKKRRVLREAFENLPNHRSSNGHTVYEYGRLFYIVTSASRSNLFHFIDLEGFADEETNRVWPTICNCEAWKYGTRPCRHIAACLEFISYRAGVPENHREEWIDRLVFLLEMGFSFIDALESESLKHLRVNRPSQIPTDNQPKRIYKLKPHEATAAT